MKNIKKTFSIRELLGPTGASLLKLVQGSDAVRVAGLGEPSRVIITEQEYLHLRSIGSLLAARDPKMGRELGIDVPEPISPQKDHLAEATLALEEMKEVLKDAPITREEFLSDFSMEELSAEIARRAVTPRTLRKKEEIYDFVQRKVRAQSGYSFFFDLYNNYTKAFEGPHMDREEFYQGLEDLAKNPDAGLELRLLLPTDGIEDLAREGALYELMEEDMETLSEGDYIESPRNGKPIKGIRERLMRALIPKKKKG